ncbi:MAG: hypothetical protein V2A61_01945 [Calditrichota bacterium]
MRLPFFGLSLLLIGGVTIAHVAAPRGIQHSDLSVELDTSAHKIEGEAKLLLAESSNPTISFLLNESFSIQSVTINNRKVKFWESRLVPPEISDNYGVYGKWDGAGAKYWILDVPPKVLKDKSLIVTVKYTGTLYSPPDNRQFSRENIAFEVSGTIGPEGIYLSPGAYWYPYLPDRLATYRITAQAPEGWRFVTDGAPLTETESGEGLTQTWQSDVPSEGLHLSAGPFIVKSLEHCGVIIATYFLPAQAELADGYLEACKRYIGLYSNLIAPYPFPQFSVVDNFMPSGYGMPGWTLLGSEVLRLPFIKFTSLGHEILHNWWGNSLLVDYRGGNWCEGLTVYQADHKFKEDADSLGGVEYRMNTLRDYAAYVTPANDYPVSEFVSRSDSHDRAIGYGKAMMIFHMLRRMLEAQDTAAFIRTLSEVYQENAGKPISWADWQQAFERAYGQNMDWFFDIWVKGVGAPRLAIYNVEVVSNAGGWQARFTVLSEPTEPLNRFLLYARGISTTGEAVTGRWMLNIAQQEFKLSGQGELARIELDPGFDAFRNIYPGEMPLTLASVLGASKTIFVLPSQSPKLESYRQAAEGLKSDDQTILMDVEILPEQLGGTLWLFGGVENTIWERFASGIVLSDEWVCVGADTMRGEALTLTTMRSNPAAESQTVALSVALGLADPVVGLRKLPHYGKYSTLVFDGDRNIAKIVNPPSGDSPMVWKAF